ncbi:MAG TPA: HEAT repeat domain-containing protein, partial [Planctomycetota bacterium]|nr:HEAT repeat domain-containing protein [Planctomycetota bacterium]
MVLSVLSSLLLLCGCGSSSHQQQQNGFSAPNSLMSQEIDSRIDQIPYQHREELLQNLLWLSQSGEQTIPALLKGLSHDNPKVRSSCAWVLGRMRDRRVINDMEKHASDQSETVRLEVCRTLVVLGDLKFSPMLIEGLDSDHKEVRFLCHEALKSSTGRDFGYDHLSEDATQRRTAVLGWRQWWSEYSGDPFFAQ